MRDQPGLQRGTEATWQCPGGPRRTRTGRCQVAGRPRGRPYGAPRVDSDKEEIETINWGIHSPIYTRQSIFLSPCGTMFPHGLTLQATWTRAKRRIQAHTVDSVDPSPRDPPSNARAAKRT